MRSNTKEFVPTVNSNLTCSLMRILDCFFAPFVPKEVGRLMFKFQKWLDNL